MLEMPYAGKGHGHTVFVGGGDGIGVLDRSSWLDNGRDAEFCGFIDIVAERDERVGRECRAV